MASVPESGLRREQVEINRLAWAFGISLLVHCLTFGIYEAGHKFGLWRNLQALSWLRSTPMLTKFLKPNQPQPPPPPELPIVFLDVNPIQATPEPPKNPKFYSNKNSVAANPDTQLDTDKPKIDGKQTEVPKTVSAPREKFTPLQPTPSPQTPQPPAPEERPKPAEPSGDLVMAKTAPE